MLNPYLTKLKEDLMKNAIKLIVAIALVIAIAFAMTACKNDDGEKEGKVYFQSGSNSSVKSARSLSTGKDIKFLVSNLLLVVDKPEKGGGNAWIVGDDNPNHPKNNIGWYDIDGLKKEPIFPTVNLQGQPHSCIRLSIKAITLNGNYIFGSEANSDFTNGGQFDIVAGDLSKLGKHEFVNPGTPEIPFVGVNGINYIETVIIYADESKLLKADDTLADEWWNCFSFSVN
jgi:hypothetical protein